MIKKVKVILLLLRKNEMELLRRPACLPACLPAEEREGDEKDEKKK